MFLWYLLHPSRSWRVSVGCGLSTGDPRAAFWPTIWGWARRCRWGVSVWVGGWVDGSTYMTVMGKTMLVDMKNGPRVMTSVGALL